MQVIARFDRKTDAEGAFSALLAAGVAASDLSLIIHAKAEGPLRQIELSNGELSSAPDAGFVDPAAEANFIGGGMGLPRLSAEGSMVFESKVGAGISTSSPDDDASTVAELDDSQTASEDMLYPASGESYGGLDAHDIERFTRTGKVDITGIGRSGISGSSLAEDTALESLYQDLSAVILPHFGIAYGDGKLATELTSVAIQSSGARDPSPDIGPIVHRMGASASWTNDLVDCWESGGALLEVSLPTEDFEALGIGRILTSHRGTLPETQEV